MGNKLLPVWPHYLNVTQAAYADNHHTAMHSVSCSGVVCQSSYFFYVVHTSVKCVQDSLQEQRRIATWTKVFQSPCNKNHVSRSFRYKPSKSTIYLLYSWETDQKQSCGQ